MKEPAAPAIIWPVNIRDAKITDVDDIRALIDSYAELDRMLFRSVSDICEHLQTFQVAELDGRVVGCCALQVIWSDLGEIKSLAVETSVTGRGVGGALARAAVDRGRRLGLPRVFALTLEPAFFSRMGFKQIDSDLLPMKVWSDCARCPKQDHCDEVAVLLEL